MFQTHLLKDILQIFFNEKILILFYLKLIMALISITISAILAIILGLLVLVWPKLLRWAVGLYLIIFGILQLISQYF